LEELLTLEELAKLLRVNEKTIYRLLNEQKIPATKVGHLWRFKKSAIDDWLNHRTIGKKADILVVDDDEAICALFKEVLEQEGHAVTSVSESIKGLALVKEHDFDIVFLDLKMPGMDGAELFARIKAVKPRTPVTIITGYRDSDLMLAALSHGPLGVMTKPFNKSDILAAVNNYINFGLSPK